MFKIQGALKLSNLPILCSMPARYSGTATLFFLFVDLIKFIYRFTEVVHIHLITRCQLTIWYRLVVKETNKVLKI